MSDKTGISWTNSTWNPVTGCTKVSPGCDNCYAETFAERFRGTPDHHFEHGFDVTMRPDRLDQVIRWRRPRLVFVNSMSDLFHASVSDAYIDRVFAAMLVAEQHTFQVLTKRPERMRRYFSKVKERSHEIVRAAFSLSLWKNPDDLADILADRLSKPLHEAAPNMWLGVSIESNPYAWRADMLRDVDAARLFLSVEPMLGAVDEVNLTNIDWVIVGGESGFNARGMELTWARDLRDRCAALEVPFFFKQLGSVLARQLGVKGKGESLDDIPTDLRFREMPNGPTMNGVLLST